MQGSLTIKSLWSETNVFQTKTNWAEVQLYLVPASSALFSLVRAVHKFDLYLLYTENLTNDN